MLKMHTKESKWVIIDRERTIVFDCSRDAWQYLFLVRDIRPRVDMGPRSLYPVRSLNPVPEMRKKKIVIRRST